MVLRFLIFVFMKLTISQKKLALGVNVVNKAVSPNNTLPVLNNILIKAEGKKLFLTATNLEIAINFWVEANVKNEGKVTIPAKLLTNYVNLLKEEDLEVNLDEGLNLHLISSSSQTKIKGIAADEFPLIPKVEKPKVLKVKRALLEEGISQVVFAASANISRPVLAGVLLEAEGDKLKLVATDSYRLGEKEIKMGKKVEEKLTCIVPARTILEVGKILAGQKEEEVEIQLTKNQALFKVGNVELTSRLIEGVFPDYEKIIPKTLKTKVEVGVEEFILAVRKVSLFVMETNNSIKLTVTNDEKLVVATEETQIGEERAEVPIKIKGENNKIALNAQFLLDLLSNIGTDKVRLEIDSKLAPAVIKPEKKDDYVHIIMPLKA